MLTARSISISLLIAAIVSPQMSIAQKVQKSASTYLSRIELKVCILKEEELDARSKAIKTAVLEHQKQLQFATDEAQALSELIRTVNNTDEKAVNAYNARNDARNVFVIQLNKDAEAENAAIAVHQAELADFMERCASRPYIMDEKKAILKELGRKPDGIRPGN